MKEPVIKRLESARQLIVSVILLDRIVATSLIAILIFIFMPLASAQATQPINISTSKSEYTVGEHVTILWDKNGPCVNIAGSGGYVNFYGPGMPGRKITLTESDVKSGSYTPTLTFDNS
jgi:hypothetical protein